MKKKEVINVPSMQSNVSINQRDFTLETIKVIQLCELIY